MVVKKKKEIKMMDAFHDFCATFTCQKCVRVLNIQFKTMKDVFNVTM